MSLIESLVSVSTGYILTILVQVYLFPLFGIRVPIADAVMISLVLVAIAFIKNYAVRRTFNYFHAR